jgi:hypothetical protein
MTYTIEDVQQVLSPENLEGLLSADIYRTIFPGRSERHEEGSSSGDENQRTGDHAGGDEPPVRLDDYGMRVWRGDIVVRKEDGTVDRSKTLYLVAGVLFDANASRKTVVEALRHIDESRGHRKYENRRDQDKEYYRIVSKLEAKKSSSSADPGQKPDGTPLIGGRVPLGEIIRRGIKPPEELVEGILLKGMVHQIFAAAGCGKSWVALWLAAVLINEGKRVLYLDTENGPNIIAGRLEALGADLEKLDEHLHYFSSPNLSMTKEGVEAYASILGGVDPSLVVFDSWVNFLSGCGLDENVSGDVARWAANFARPARDLGITVLLLDHVPKDGSNSRGSGRKKEEVDVQWQLKNPKAFDRNTVGEIKLFREKDREGWLPKALRFSVGGTEDGFVFEGLNEDTEMAEVLDHHPNVRKILNVLENTFGSDGATDAEWKKACEEEEGVKKASYYRARQELVEGEDFSKEGNRFYPQVPQGMEVEW